MKVRKVGQLNQSNEITLVADRTRGLVLLTNNLYNRNEPTTILLYSLVVGEGAAAREIEVEIPVATEVLNAQRVGPASLVAGRTFNPSDGGYVAFFIFRNQIFSVTTQYLEDTTEEEASLLIKKQVISDDSRLKRLRREVETLERVVNTVGVKRTAIPEDIKLLVYSRDEGKCVRCGSSEKLHFDHIIPVAKGGGNSDSNIQLLCDYCNLQKSDKIAF